MFMQNFSVQKVKPISAVCLLGFLGFMIVGCSQNELNEINTQTPVRQLTPYLTATHDEALNPTTASGTATPLSMEISSPTPTPVVYEVVENDTLTGIAFQHSVALEDLIAANPGIDPNFLTIGMTLTIPIDDTVISALPTATPVSIILQPPECYPQLDGSLNCLSVVENNQRFAVENVTVMIVLNSQNGNNSISETAITPLNIVRPGEKAAVSAIFDPPIFVDYTAQSHLLSVIPVAADDQRYLETSTQIQEATISGDGLHGFVTGDVEILSGQPAEEQTNVPEVWIAAFAYDRENKVVGIRKLIINDGLTSGNTIQFSIDVYSLGPPIEHVDVKTEVRP